MKSSFSFSNGNCVEVKPEPWKKSTRSVGNGACVEVQGGNMLRVRDSQDPNGSQLAFKADVWNKAMSQIKAGGMPSPRAGR